MCFLFQAQFPSISERAVVVNITRPNPGDLYRSELHIEDLMFADTGYYTCSYAPEHGATNATVYLYVPGKSIPNLHLLNTPKSQNCVLNAASQQNGEKRLF